MSNKKQYLLGAILGSILLALFMSYAGSDNGQRFGFISIFAFVVIIAFTINWFAYVPAIMAQTEHYYDLIGAATYLSVIIIAISLSDNLDARSFIVAAMVIFWALRLGSYLFLRVKRNGSDGRFNEMKTKPLNFLVAWTMQALWVIVTAACALTIITSEQRVPISSFAIIGAVVWIFGMSVELIADYQKSQFRRNPANSGKFISEGLWAWSQHPNYFGEIVLWTGIAIIAIPILSGAQWFCLISPVFVFVLLRYISGVNLSHEIGDDRWGGEPGYLIYRRTTPVIVLKPPKK